MACIKIDLEASSIILKGPVELCGVLQDQLGYFRVLGLKGLVGNSRVLQGLSGSCRVLKGLIGRA